MYHNSYTEYLRTHIKLRANDNNNKNRAVLQSHWLSLAERNRRVDSDWQKYQAVLAGLPAYLFSILY